MPEFIQSIRGITSGFDLTKLIRTHSSTIQAVLSARLHFYFLQQTNTILPHFGKPDSHGKNRVVMVGQQSRTLQ